jgi:uncharacterized protein YecE (DUF72 family)
MKLSVGTSGYSYKEWKGPFYPEKLAARDMLSFYAEKLPAVEINNTFYRMPKTSVLETWRSQVGPDFRFAIKASRRITHFKRLVEAQEETQFLLGNTTALGAHLGVLLFQLPPNLKADVPRLEQFLELLPDGTRAAFEFRHPSWSDEAVHALLRARDAALVQVDSEDAPAGELIATAGFGYLRLRRPGYDRADLAGWAQRIREQGWEEAFVFFKHEDEGAGPRMAAEFLEVAARAGERKGAIGAREEAERDRAAG